MESTVEIAEIQTNYQTNVNQLLKIQLFAEFTRNMIKNEKFNIARKCLDKAGRVYSQGNQHLKDLIVFHFLYTLSATIAYSHCEEILPVNLKTALQQLNERMDQERRDNKDEL